MGDSVVVLPNYEAKLFGVLNGLIRVDQSLGRMVFECNCDRTGDRIMRYTDRNLVLTLKTSCIPNLYIKKRPRIICYELKQPKLVEATSNLQ